MSLVTNNCLIVEILIISIADIQFRKKNGRQSPHTLYCEYIRRKLAEGHTHTKRTVPRKSWPEFWPSNWPVPYRPK